MNPYNKTNLNSPEIISSSTVLWEGPNIPCLELCTGEKVDSVIAKVGTKLCTLVTDIKELETLDYSCIISKFGYTGTLLTPENFSFKLLFQLLLDNDCKLQDLIKNIPITSTTTSVNLTGLDLKCIKDEILNLCGQIPVNLDILKVTQAIINILCGIQDDVADILIRLINVESQIASLGNPGSGGYEEPEITSCLSVVPTLMNEHISTITDPAICEIKSLLGNEAQIEDVLSKQCLADYISNPNIIQNATNLAQSSANKEVIICDLLERIKSIEDNCCSFDCNDIKIGFTQTYNVITNSYNIEFSFGAGTSIPVIFQDCGSTFILTDWKGVTKTITNTSGTLINGSNFTISLVGSGLDYAKPIELQIKTCFTNTQNGLICKDCFGGSLDVGANTNTNSCWEFIVPKTDVLGCGNKYINYDSLSTTQGTYTATNMNTSISGNLQLPVFSTPNNILNNVICSNTKLLMTLKDQSSINPPVLNLYITNTSPILHLSVVGTPNTNCLC